jgi:hypothetical protein
VCDLETSRMGAPYIYDISHLRVNLGDRWGWAFDSTPILYHGEITPLPIVNES